VSGTLARLVAFAGVPARHVALSAGLGVLAVAFGVGLMTAAGYLISRAAEQPPILSLTVTIVAVRFFGLARPIARYLDRVASHDVALSALGRIRARFYERIEPLAPGQLEGYRRGELLGRMVGDVDSLQGLYVRGLTPLLVALVVGASCVALTAVFLPAAAAILALGLVLVGGAVPALTAALNRAAGRRQGAVRSDLTAELVELLRGAPELVVYGREAETLARIRERSDELARLGRRDGLAAGVAEGLSILIAGLTVAGVLAAAAQASIDRVLVATAALLALASFECVTPLRSSAAELWATIAAGRRVFELVDREPSVRDPAEPRPAPLLPGVVALEGVTARYAPGLPSALTRFDLRLEPGRRIALVGPSGAGKTTVTNLLLRLLDPEEGRVTLGGRDLREYRQEDVRRAIAVAGQDAHLFSTSIRENVRLARPSASDHEVEAALRRAGIWYWVRSLPKGLDTPVGEEGRELSGGERQRLVVARALLTEASILVLDEPTAHLDSLTAERLIEDVFSAAGESSVLLITHRPEGLELVDEVVALEEGSIRTAP
jgi:ATP-binding cassette, subfamily C, bacterial CydC